MKKNNNIDEHMTTQDQTDAIIKLLTNILECKGSYLSYVPDCIKIEYKD